MKSCKKTIEFIKHKNYYEIYMAGDGNSGISVVEKNPKEVSENFYSYLEEIMIDLKNKNH